LVFALPLQHEDGERWHIPTVLYGAKTQKIIIILTAVKTSNLTVLLVAVQEHSEKHMGG
jgi:hypothetical protein